MNGQNSRVPNRLSSGGDHESAGGVHAEAAGGRRGGENEGQQGQYDGCVARDDCRPSAAYRCPQRDAVIVGSGQFLAIA